MRFGTVLLVQVFGAGGNIRFAMAGGDNGRAAPLPASVTQCSLHREFREFIFLLCHDIPGGRLGNEIAVSIVVG